MTTPERQYRGRGVSERKAERRRRFLVAATQVFAERGYTNTSLADICTAARLSKRQFYEEFDTRECVLVAAYDQINDDAAAAVARALDALDPGVDPETGMTAVLSAYLESFGIDYFRAKLAFVEVVGVSDRMEKHRRERRLTWVPLLQRAIGRIAGMQAHFRADAALTASTFVGAVNGLTHEWLMMDPRPPVSELSDILVPVALSLITVATADGIDSILA